MPNKTETDVQINTSYWILIFRTNNKKTALMLKIYHILATLCSRVSSYDPAMQNS